MKRKWRSREEIKRKWKEKEDCRDLFQEKKYQIQDSELRFVARAARIVAALQPGCEEMKRE